MGNGLWKFNRLLRDMKYIKVVKECIQRVKEQYMLPIYNLEYIIENEQNLELQISGQLFLETLLMEIRGKFFHTHHTKRSKIISENIIQKTK